MAGFSGASNATDNVAAATPAPAHDVNLCCWVLMFMSSTERYESGMPTVPKVPSAQAAGVADVLAVTP